VTRERSTATRGSQSRRRKAPIAEETFEQLKKMGASARLNIHSSDGRATSTLAYCTVEFDFKVNSTSQADAQHDHAAQGRRRLEV